MQPITEVFKHFCKERHEEDKGKNFNLLQEVYANTELFDISLYDFLKNINTCKGSEIIKRGNTRAISFITNETLCLPFQSNFIKCEKEGSYIFIREFEPETLTGSMYTQNSVIKGNLPFAIRLFENNQVAISTDITPLLNINSKVIKENIEEVVESLFITIISALNVINNLSKKSVVVDTPSTPQTEYYRRKHADTIKRYNRPIYYILDKKEETKKSNYNKIESRGHLEFTYAFKIRGHWRRISEKSYGKDRQGNYNILGYTWVTEYIKGEGELVKKLRVVK